MDYYKTMTVDIPTGELGGLTIKKVEVSASSISNFRESMHGRGTRSGTYTAMLADGQFWMSDTDAEKRDHLPAVWKISDESARRVLINGLGIGMVLKAALACEHVEHIDVVEIDKRVIDLVGPHYADPRLTIHYADAYEQARAWPTGTRWDVAWHDVWADLCTDNLPKMARLHRSYGRRTGWQDSWGKELLKLHRERERRQDGLYSMFRSY